MNTSPPFDYFLFHAVLSSFKYPLYYSTDGEGGGRGKISAMSASGLSVRLLLLRVHYEEWGPLPYPLEIRDFKIRDATAVRRDRK